MKNIKFLFQISILIILVSLVGCDTDDDMPTLNVKVSATNVNAGDMVDFTIMGDAETFVIYTGDPGHDYLKSYQVITKNKKLDDERVNLSSDSIPKFETKLRTDIASHNDELTANEDIILIDADMAMQKIRDEIANKDFDNKETARYMISLILPQMDRYSSWDYIMEFFNDNSIYLAPEGGFSTGVALNRYNSNYSYSYNTPGTYTATIIATNLSEKQYSGDGATSNGTASGSDYEAYISMKEITITVN